MRTLLIIFCCLISLTVAAQADSVLGPTAAISDSLIKKDSLKTIYAASDSVKHADSLMAPQLPAVFIPKTWKEDTTFTGFFKMDLFPSLQMPAIFMISQPRTVQQNDWLFYLLLTLTLLVALGRTIFRRYFNGMFKVFFQHSFRQKQTREQLSQDVAAGLFFNILFSISFSVFVVLIVGKNLVLHYGFWNMLLYVLGIVVIIYFIKFIIINVAGFLFNISQTTAIYLFIVFMINRVLGILLVPLLFLITYSDQPIKEYIETGALVLTVFMFLYRYIISFTTVGSELRFHPLHFFIYLCAFEIAPLLVIYKLVMNQIGLSI